MSYEAMIALLSEELENIKPITETPVPSSSKHNPNELTEAEDEISEKEKDENEKDDEYREEHNESEEEEDTGETDNSDLGLPEDTEGEEDATQKEVSKDMDNADISEEELDAKMAKMSFYQQLTMTYIKAEYGSPSGSNSSICPNCAGNADAADAAIVDNDVTKTERTEPFGEVDNSGSGGGDYGSDMGGGDEYDFGDSAFQFKYQPGEEDFRDFLDEVGKTIKEIGVMVGATAKAGERLFHFASKTLVGVTRKLEQVIERNFIKIRHVSKFYEYKFKPILKLINEKDAEEISLEAFTAKEWINLQQGCNEVYKLLVGMKKQLLSSEKDFPKVVKAYTDVFSKLGVNINENTPSGCLSKLYDHRANSSLAELGYNKRDLLALIRHLGELGNIADKDALKGIKDVVVSYGKLLRNESAKTSKAGDDKKAKQMAVITEVNAKKFDFLTKVVDVYCDLTSKLVDDLYRVCYEYEKSVIPKYLKE